MMTGGDDDVCLHSRAVVSHLTPSTSPSEYAALRTQIKIYNRGGGEARARLLWSGIIVYTVQHLVLQSYCVVLDLS